MTMTVGTNGECNRKKGHKLPHNVCNHTFTGRASPSFFARQGIWQPSEFAASTNIQALLILILMQTLMPVRDWRLLIILQP